MPDLQLPSQLHNTAFWWPVLISCLTNGFRPHRRRYLGAAYSYIGLDVPWSVCIGNESVPKITINDTINLLF